MKTREGFGAQRRGFGAQKKTYRERHCVAYSERYCVPPLGVRAREKEREREEGANPKP